MRKLFTSFVLCGLLAPMATMAQFQLQDEALANPKNEPAPVHPVPHERQLLWNETEFYAFFHYGMNTFTGKEWGYGDEKESIYAPKGMMRENAELFVELFDLFVDKYKFELPDVFMNN